MFELIIIINVFENAYYIAFISATILAGFWALHLFITSENKAGISIQINKIEHQSAKQGGYFLNININVKNIGNRELEIIHKEKDEKGIEQFRTYISIYKIDDNQIENTVINELNPPVENKIFFMASRHTSGEDSQRPRIRSGVDYNYPYNVHLKEAGRYFIEFTIKTNMDKYKGTFSYLFSKFSRLSTKFKNNFFPSWWKKILFSNKDIKFITWREKAFYMINEV